MNSASYADIQQALEGARALTDAAEAHGTLAGSLCSASAYRFEDWLGEILPEGRASPDLAQLLREVFSGTASALADAQMEFEPLLPGEAQELADRAAALGQWCQGFLYGLGSGSLGDVSRLPGEVGEIVRDLSEITNVGVDARESEESNESAYAELVEFVRVGVQLIFEELGPFRQPPKPSGAVLH
jgi:uncharacterized protein YgfB (UPF0149 family)